MNSGQSWATGQSICRNDFSPETKVHETYTICLNKTNCCCHLSTAQCTFHVHCMYRATVKCTLHVHCMYRATVQCTYQCRVFYVVLVG